MMGTSGRAGGKVGMAVVAALSVLVVSVASGENWPRFRGPNGQGISETKGIPTR